MKIQKKYLGQYVEIKWRDPIQDTICIKELPTGHNALATWTERGILSNLDEGVVIIEHSHNFTRDEEKVHCTWVPEDLIFSIRIFLHSEEDNW